MLASKLLSLRKISQQINIRCALVHAEKCLIQKFSSSVNAPVIPTEADTPVESGNTTEVKNTETDIPDFSSIIDVANDEHSQKPDIVDININDMMEEDGDFGTTIGVNDESNIIKSMDLSGSPVAPIDINPWTDELDAAQGTVDMENLIKPEIEYPPIPENRENNFQFKGIRIKLPMRMLKPATYRYRMDDDDQDMADDMHICKY